MTEAEAKAIEQYQQSGSVQQHAKSLGVSAAQFAWLLGAAGVPLKDQGRYDRKPSRVNATDARRLDMRKRGMSVQEIAKAEGVTKQAVSHSLRAAALRVVLSPNTEEPST